MPSSNVHVFPVLFSSQGVPLAGAIHRNVPNLSERQPAVIVTGSWLTVKEQMPAVYASRLAALGYTAFTFDFAGFGESGGEPRQAELPDRKIRDIRAAADFLATLSSVRRDSVGHLAVCASAQYALAAAASGARVRSIASVAGWFHDLDSVAPFYGGAPGVEARLEKASRAAEVYARTREVKTVPAYAPGNEEASMFFELPYYGLSSRGAVPEWKNEMAVLSWLPWLTFDGISAASSVTVPVLMVHGDGCVLPDNARRVYDALAGSKNLVWTEGTQTDFYDQNEAVDKAVAAAYRHFQETLG
jgi:fermentation-respiration switch protein FrsA (DUF1100 family)